MVSRSREGGDMLTRKSLAITIGAVSLLVIAGCGKKEEQTDTSAFSDMPELEGMEEATDTADIFDEFYESDPIEEEPVAETEPEPMAESFTSASSYSPEFIPGGPYVVQVSTIHSRAMAEDVARQLENRGFPSYLAEVQNPTPELTGTFYRVRIGGFNSISAAREFGNNSLIPNGYEFWVDNRSNDNIGMGGYGLGESGSSDYGSYGSSDYGSTESSSSYGSSAYESSSYTETPTQTQSSGSDWETEPAQPTTQTTTESATATDAETQTPAATEAQTAPADQSTDAASDDWGNDDWGDDGW